MLVLLNFRRRLARCLRRLPFSDLFAVIVDAFNALIGLLAPLLLTFSWYFDLFLIHIAAGNISLVTILD